MMKPTTCRAAIRTVNSINRHQVRRGRCVRFQSTSTQQPASSHSAHVAAGVAGGSLVFLAGYAWYHFSGAKTVINTVHSTKATFENAFKKTSQNAPQPNEAVKWLRETVQGYTKLIPGASGYVDTAFNDLDKIQEQHGEEVENIVKDAYNELKDVTKAGASWEAAVKAGNVLQKAISRLSDLAQDAAGDLLDNHPEMKEKFGDKFNELKSMGASFGPEAKKQVDETWRQVQDIVKSGPMNPENYDKIQRLVQENIKKVKGYGDDAWKKGVEEAKPVLDKYPKVKEFVEQNKDQLLQGDIGKLWNKIQELAKSGDSDEAMKFVKQQVEEAKDKASSKAKSGSNTGLAGLASAFGKVPGADELGEKFEQLQKLYEKRGHEAESLIKSAIEDVKNVLSKKVEEGRELQEKAANDVKK